MREMEVEKKEERRRGGEGEMRMEGRGGEGICRISVKLLRTRLVDRSTLTFDGLQSRPRR